MMNDIRRHGRGNPAEAPASREADRRAVPFGWILPALLIPLFLAGLGAIPILDPDEPYYAVPALEMLRGGAWLIPLFHGQPWFDKPILFYWTILASYKLFGVSEFSARLASALSALGGALALFWFGARLGLARRAAFLAALALATGIEYVVLARTAITDMTLTLLLTAGMLSAACALRERKAVWAAAAGAAFGLAVLTKGPVGVLVPAVALAAYALFAGRGSRPGLSAHAFMALVAVLVAAPWYVWVAAAHPELLAGFVAQGNLGRFVQPEHSSSIFFYLGVLLLGLFPWSGALPGALVSAFRESRRSRKDGTPGFLLPLYCLCWAGAVLGLFQLSASKLASYVLPAFPPLAILVGVYWDLLPDRPIEWRRPSGPLASASLGLAVGAAMAAGAVALGVESASGRAGWFAAGAVAACGSLASWMAVRRGRLAGFISAQVATTFGLVLVLLLLVVPSQTARRSTAPLVHELEARGLAGRVAGAYGVTRSFSLEFYLGRSFPRMERPERLQAAASADPGGVWFVPTTDLPSLGTKLGLGVEVVVRGPRISAVRFRKEPPGRGSTS